MYKTMYKIMYKIMYKGGKSTQPIPRSQLTMYIFFFFIQSHSQTKNRCSFSDYPTQSIILYRMSIHASLQVG